MANVIITIEGPLMDGHRVTFKAPCDCTGIEKLDVRYVQDNTQKSKLFTMKDAHGNDLDGVGNLFMEGAYVHAILNTALGFAYLQNSDTNVYLEGKFGTKVEMDELWRNSSLSSSFAAQTIELDLSPYEYVIILGYSDINNRRMIPAMMIHTPSATGGYMGGVSASGCDVFSRTVAEITSTGIRFAGAYISKNGAAGTTDNKYCVPYRIIGVKGV